MTKKDYIILVRILAQTARKYEAHLLGGFWFGLLEVLCDELKKDNPNFNQDKFLAEIGKQITE